MNYSFHRLLDEPRQYLIIESICSYLLPLGITRIPLFPLPYFFLFHFSYFLLLSFYLLHFSFLKTYPSFRRVSRFLKQFISLINTMVYHSFLYTLSTYHLFFSFFFSRIKSRANVVHILIFSFFLFPHNSFPL